MTIFRADNSFAGFRILQRNWWAVVVALPVAIGGCAASQAGETDQASTTSNRTASKGPTPRGTDEASVELRPTAEIVRERLLGKSNGLEVRRWTVLDASDRAMGLIAERSEGCAAEQAACERLRSNGLRFARVPLDQVEAIAEELGGATLDRTEWHGQVFEWISLREQPIDSRGTAVAIDGRVRRFDRGDFRLLMRAWTVAMEEGPCLHMELLPQHRLPQPQNLRRLLGEKPEDAGEAFASVALDLQLQAGFAYVLISESPNIDWPQLDAPALAAPVIPASAMVRQPPTDDPKPAAASPQSAAPIPPVRPAKPRIGPDDYAGPEAGVPRTLGEVLLPSMRSPPTREILLFVPRIPDELFPPVYESELAARRGNPSAVPTQDSPSAGTGNGGSGRE